MIYLASAIFALIFAAAEAVTYIGFVHNHLGIYAYYIYLTSLVLVIYKTSYSKFIGKSFVIAAYLSSALYLALIFAEIINYPNFVFTITHINPFTFQFFVALLWFHTLTIHRVKFTKSLLLAGLIYVGIDGAGRTLGVMYKGLRDVINDPFATYAQKMTKVYPGFYPAMQEIKLLTSPDSMIVIPPPASPWDIEGNQAMVNYFLYPRKVVNSQLEILPDIVKSQNTYVLISKGTMSMFSSYNIYEYHWPKNPLNASQIWEIDTVNHKVINHQRDYNPAIDKWGWGLIEVKHE
ncbi:hypothetical protein KBD75_00465 [Candidatus Woesebacteria bacterium]|nr:hypothetical protein [Candidatus Woesebacteria bacterium]